MIELYFTPQFITCGRLFVVKTPSVVLRCTCHCVSHVSCPHWLPDWRKCLEMMEVGSRLPSSVIVVAQSDRMSSTIAVCTRRLRLQSYFVPTPPGIIHVCSGYTVYMYKYTITVPVYCLSLLRLARPIHCRHWLTEPFASVLTNSFKVLQQPAYAKWCGAFFVYTCD